jgi:hypothetical protein
VKLRLLIPGALLGLSVTLFAAKPLRPRPAASPRPAANSSFSPDKGRLRILKGGSEVGTEQFEMARSGDAWIARGETVLHVPGSGEIRSTGQLRLSPDGTPLHYDWTAQGKKKASGSVDFKNGTAKTTIDVGGKEPLRQDFKFSSPRVAILDNNLYDQYAILAELYDWNAKGTQTFPVLIPQDMTPGSITVESLGTKSIDGNSLEALSVRTADIEVRVYFDARHRLMRLEVPAAQVVMIRQ